MTEVDDGDVAFRLESSLAAQGAAQWLRMLAQSGLSMVPHVSAVAVPGLSSGAESESDDCRAAWQSILVPSLSVEGAAGPASGPAAAGSGVATGPSVRGPLPLGGAPTSPAAVSPAAALQAGGDLSVTDSSEALAVKRPAAAPRFVQSSASASGAGTPVFRGVSTSNGEDGPPLSQTPDLADADRVLALQQLAVDVSQCTRCPDLVGNRTQTVFGFGAARTRLVLMGEAPGAEEDRLGVPMVGASGQLLDKIIAAMKLRREEVYILNTVKCRPPKNRNPLDVECSNCRPFWVRQLEILRPEVIVCLGAVASKTLLQTTDPVGRLRGTVHDYRGAKVIVTYHPSYLLRTEDKKRETWDDMKVVMSLLGISRT